MTIEEAKSEIKKVFEPAFANYIIVALTEGATPSERKTNDVLDKIRTEIVELQKDYQEYWWAYDDAIEIINKYKEGA